MVLQYTDSIVSGIHVNTTEPRNITCTLVATGGDTTEFRVYVQESLWPVVEVTNQSCIVPIGQSYTRCSIRGARSNDSFHNSETDEKHSNWMKAPASPAQNKEGKRRNPNGKWMKMWSQPCNLATL